MQIAITSRGPGPQSIVDPRFGRAAYVVFHDTERGSYESVENVAGRGRGQGAGIQAAALVAERKADALLTGHCGPNAYRTLRAAGVQVYTGVGGEVDAAVQRLVNGSLAPSASPDVEGHW